MSTDEIQINYFDKAPWADSEIPLNQLEAEPEQGVSALYFRSFPEHALDQIDAEILYGRTRSDVLSYAEEYSQHTPPHNWNFTYR